jgi:uncharacterized protein
MGKENNVSLPWTERLWTRIGRFVERRSGLIVAGTLVVSLALLAAVVSVPSQPTGITYADDDPAVLTERRIQEAMPPKAFAVPFLVSGTPEDPNAISRAVFDEVLQRERALRDDPRVAPYVFTHVHPHLQAEVSSIWSLPDSLRAMMNGDTPLVYATGWHQDLGGPGVRYEEATDAQWQDALGRLLSFETRDGERPFMRSVSEDIHQDEEIWRATSMFVVPALEHARVFEDHTDEPALATAGTPFIEELELHIWQAMEAEAQHTSWLGIGLGIQHEIEAQVAESARLVAGSFLVIGVLLYLTLRNWRDFLVAYLTLPLVIVWMTGIARLIGLENNQFTAMLPVLILALGVDFAIHGVRRYREERSGLSPPAALRRSLTRVGPVLLLAAATTATAFLSNSFSNVDALTHWGLMGGIGIACALFLAGVFAPAARQLWDRHRDRRGTLDDGPRGGVIARRLREGTLLGRLSAWGARRAIFIVVLVAIVTGPAAYLAMGVTSDFNADDFLSRDSFLLEGSERLRTEFPQEGEPVVLLVEGDLSDPRVHEQMLVAFQRFDEAGYRSNTDYSIVRAVMTAMANPDENDAHYRDDNGNGIPTHKADLERLLDRITSQGVWAAPPDTGYTPPDLIPGVPLPNPLAPEPPQAEPILVYAPETLQELIHKHPENGYDMAVMHFGIPGTEEITVIPRAEDELYGAAAGLLALQGEAVTALSLTGEPIKRYNMVQSITQSLQISITLSVIGCFLIVLVVLRDWLYAIATTLPVLVLVAWLFAFMVLTGMSLNVVTVTVAAMAIGVGIDYSIHITGRYREEARNGHDPILSVRRAMDSSGVALLGSATTTVAGFLVLTFAPMPLFVTFGVITAAMTAASFLAAATLLPPLLVLIDKRRHRTDSIRTTTRRHASSGSPRHPPTSEPLDP